MFALDWGHCNLNKSLLQLQLWCQISQISKLMWQFILFKSLWKMEKKKKLMKQFCPGGADGKASCLQCGRPGFNPWVGKILWRRKWQPTPVLLPGKSHGRRSLVGYRPWGCKESDTTERLHFHFTWESYGGYLSASAVTHSMVQRNPGCLRISKGIMKSSCLLCNRKWQVVWMSQKNAFSGWFWLWFSH